MPNQYLHLNVWLKHHFSLKIIPIPSNSNFKHFVSLPKWFQTSEWIGFFGFCFGGGSQLQVDKKTHHSTVPNLATWSFQPTPSWQRIWKRCAAARWVFFFPEDGGLWYIYIYVASKQLQRLEMTMKWSMFWKFKSNIGQFLHIFYSDSEGSLIIFSVVFLLLKKQCCGRFQPSMQLFKWRLEGIKLNNN